MSPANFSGEPKTAIDTVSMIADAFRQKFGDGALKAAELQRNLASNESVAKWNEVLIYLKAGQLNSDTEN